MPALDDHMAGSLSPLLLLQRLIDCARLAVAVYFATRPTGSNPQGRIVAVPSMCYKVCTHLIDVIMFAR